MKWPVGRVRAYPLVHIVVALILVGWTLFFFLFWEPSSSFLWATHFMWFGYKPSFTSRMGTGLRSRVGQSPLLGFCWVYEEGPDSCLLKHALVNDIYWVYFPTRKIKAEQNCIKLWFISQEVLQNLYISFFFFFFLNLYISMGDLNIILQQKEAHRMRIFHSK